MQRLYQTINSPLMIKLFFPSLILLLSFKPGKVNEVQKLPVIKKELKVDSAFQNIQIEGDVSIILTNDPAGTIIIEGTEKDLDRIRPVYENNRLLIDVNHKRLFAKLTIWLSAITLQTLQLNGDGKISSTDFIKSDHLHISLNGYIKVKVKTMGQLSFDTPDDTELLSKRSSTKKGK